MLDNIQNAEGNINQKPFEPFVATNIDPKESDKFSRGREGGFFGDTRVDFVELAAYQQDFEFYNDITSKLYKIDEEGQLLLPTYQHLNRLDLQNETGYILRYNFLRKVIYPSIPSDFNILPLSNQQEILRRNLGNRVGMKLFVHEISEGRTEVRVLPKLIGSNTVDQPFQEAFFSFFSQEPNGKSFDYVMNFGQSQLFDIINWTIDDATFPEYPNSFVLKTYQSIPNSISRNDEFWINKKVFPSYIDRVRYVEAQQPDDLVYLRGPDFNISPNESDFRDTGKQTWESLLDSSEETSSGLLERLLTAETSTSLNVDYTDFSNFIKFSSALERVNNFEFKLGIYSNYTDSIERIESNAAVSSTGELLNPQKKKEVSSLKDKRTSLTEAFDGFETWVFEQDAIRDGSGDMLDVNDATVQSFLDDLKTSADEYDRRNPASLKNQLPEYVRADQRNEDFEIFINMIAHYFDIIWTYIKHMGYVYDRSEDINEVESLSSELTQFVANSFGYDVYNGFELEDLFSFLVNGNDSTDYENVQKQVWRRVLNNIPYLSKTKGTRRSIEALLSIYGVPKIGMSIREYGGGSDQIEPGFQLIENETNSLGFYGSNSVNIDWTFPNQKVRDVELRFKTEYQGSGDLNLLELDNGAVSVDLKRFSDPNVDERYGYLEISLNTIGQSFTVGTGSDRIPYFDGQYNSIHVSFDVSSNTLIASAGKVSRIGPYEFGSGQVATDSVTWYVISSIVPTSGFQTDFENASILSVGSSFNGDIDNIKVWKQPISEPKFREHVLAPFKYDYDNEDLITSSLGDTTRELTENLWIHVDFSDAEVENESPNVGYISNITTTGYSPLEDDDFTSYIRENYVKPLKAGSNAVSNTKIRVEDSFLLGALSPSEKRESGSLDRTRKDSNKIGVYFSPNSVLNQDITASVGFQDVNSLLADPENLYQETYRKLDLLNKKYWIKYPRSIDFNLYFRYIDQFNRAFFKQLKNILPARSSLTYGALIEPHLLEKYRAKTPEMTRERLDKEALVPISDIINIPSNQLNNETTIDVSCFVVETAELPVLEINQGVDVDAKSTRTYRYAGNFLKETGFETLQSPDLYPEGSYYINESTGERNPDSYQRFRRVPFRQQIKFIFPINDEYDYTHNNYFQVFGFAFTYNDEDTKYNSARYSLLDPDQLVSTPLGNIQPPTFPYKRYHHFIFNREFRTPTKRMKGISMYGISAAQSKQGVASCGVLNHSGTTVDGGPAVVFNETTSERLIVSPSDRDKGEGPILDVE